MPKEQIIVGLDVGTCFIRTVVARIRPDNHIKPQIIGVGQMPSFGLRRGVVIDIEETVKNINQSVQAAEQSSGLSIDRVVVSISGNHIVSRPNKGVVAVSSANQEVLKGDVKRAIDTASVIPLAQNREIIHVIPRNFSIDDQDSIKDPVGMTGAKLEVDTLIIEGAVPFIKNLSKCVLEADLEIEDTVLAPLAASRAALGKRQKELGVLALDLGGGTAGLTVFEEGDIIHSCILPVGSSHITRDIAIGLRSDIDLAEKVKLEYGSALSSEISKKQVIDLSKLGLDEKGVISRVMVAEIIEARLSEILDLTNKELKKINRQGLLPAGVVLLGGGAKMRDLVDLTKDKLKLPVQIGFPLEIDGIIDEVDDPAYATAIGLILWNMDTRINRGITRIFPTEFPIGSTINKLKAWFSP